MAERLPLHTDLAVTRPASAETLWTDYATTLRRCVREGRVDYRILSADHTALDRTLAALASVGPTTVAASFPDDRARLAYWINAYNAAMLRSVVAAIAPIVRADAQGGTTAGQRLARLQKFRPPRSLEWAYRFDIDGRPRTPADLRFEAVAAADHMPATGLPTAAGWPLRPCVDFSLCSGVAGGPPLAVDPYFPDLLGHQLNEQLRAALGQSQIVFIDHGFQRLRLWPPLLAARGELIRGYQRRTGVESASLLNVLLDISPADRRRELNAAVGYAERALPSDPRINQADGSS